MERLKLGAPGLRSHFCSSEVDGISEVPPQMLPDRCIPVSYVPLMYKVIKTYLIHRIQSIMGYILSGGNRMALYSTMPEWDNSLN